MTTTHEVDKKNSCSSESIFHGQEDSNGLETFVLVDNQYGDETKDEKTELEIQEENNDVYEHFIEFDENNNIRYRWKLIKSDEDEKRISKLNNLFLQDELLKQQNFTRITKEVVVAALFKNVYKIFRRGNQVRFPVDIVSKADTLGDVAGKDRQVRRSSTSSLHLIRKRIASSSKSDSVKMAILRAKYYDLGNNRGSICHNCLLGDCLGGEAEDFTNRRPGELSRAYLRKMASFHCCLELAGIFVDEHLNTTLRIALEVINMSSQPNLEENVTAYNNLSANIWMFSYSLRTLFDSEVTPSKTEFKKLIESLNTLALQADDAASKVVRHFYDFRTFEKQTGVILEKLIKEIGMKSSIPYHKPISKGGCLILKKIDKKAIQELPAIKIVCRPMNSVKWSGFSTIPKVDTLDCLHSLLTNVTEALERLMKQERFLLDDVRNRKFYEEDPDFITLVTELEEKYMYFKKSPETTAEHKQTLETVLTQFVDGFNIFIKSAEFMMRSIVELRDMIAVCYCYLEGDFNTVLLEVRDCPTVYRPRKYCSCLFSDYRRHKKNGDAFNPWDFYRTHYRDSLLSHYVSAGSYDMKLKLTADFDEGAANSQAKVTTEQHIKFSPSEPLITEATIISEEKEVRFSSTSESRQTASEPVLKSILKSKT